MPYNASSDLWYQYFTADGPQIWILIAVFGARSALAMLGIMFNVGLICITIKNKSLQGICGILLAIDSFFSTTMDATFLISFFVVISGVRFVRYQYCFPIIIVPGTLFGNCAQLTMVFTGLDRLSSVIFLMMYKMRNKAWTIAFVCLMLLCYSTYQFIIYYMAYEINMDMMVSCSTTEMTSGSMAALMNANGYTLSAILMTLYALIWLLTFKLNSTSKRVDQANRRLVKSLMLIIGLNMVGVFVKSFFLFLFQFVSINVFVSKGYAIASSFLTIVVYSANAPVLYAMSSEYRTQFNKCFQWLPKMVKNGQNSTAVQSIGQQTSTTIHAAQSLARSNYARGNLQ